MTPQELAKLRQEYFNYTRIRNVLESNKNKNFVQRMLRPKDYPTIATPEGFGPKGSTSTHLMSQGYTTDESGKKTYIAYPMIFQDNESKSLYFKSKKDAAKEAIKRGEFIQFDSEKEAVWFTQNYKDVMLKQD